MRTLAKSSFYAILLSALTTLVLWQFSIGPDGDFSEFFNPEIMSRTEPTVVYLFIAIVAGLTTAFARMKPELNETLPGTAIAIALVPPLATIGIGVAHFNLSIISGALSMFVLNSVGIIVAALVIFSLMDIREKKKVAERAHEKADLEQIKIKEEFEEEKMEINQEQTLEEIGIEKIKKDE
jgi:uncharacterized membrane protein